jgi:hypothetical protein
MRRKKCKKLAFRTTKKFPEIFKNQKFPPLFLYYHLKLYYFYDNNFSPTFLIISVAAASYNYYIVDNCRFSHLQLSNSKKKWRIIGGDAN